MPISEEIPYSVERDEDIEERLVELEKALVEERRAREEAVKDCARRLRKLEGPTLGRPAEKARGGGLGFKGSD